MSYLMRIELWFGGIFGMVYSFITGNFGEAFWILLGVMTMDVVTGLMKGAKGRKLKSLIMSVGLMKKGAIIAAVILCWLLDFLMNSGEPAFVTMMIWLSIANETISVAENLKMLGVALPKSVTERLGEIADDSKLLDTYLSKDKEIPSIEKKEKKEQTDDVEERNPETTHRQERKED